MFANIAKVQLVLSFEMCYCLTLDELFKRIGKLKAKHILNCFAHD